MSNTRQSKRRRAFRAIRSNIPTAGEASLVIASALLTVLSFPNFNLWFLAWISLTPLLFVVVREKPARGFVAGWLWGTIFFYGSCWWLTYPMTHYAHIRAGLAGLLLLAPVTFVGLFFGLASLFIGLLVRRFGTTAVLLAPFVWVSLDWLRYVVSGQLWNSLGYSQAFQPILIETARWGGIYLVTAAIVAFNAALTLAATTRKLRSVLISIAIIIAISGLITLAALEVIGEPEGSTTDAAVIAVQPNVPMDLAGDPAQMDWLVERHFSLSRRGLQLGLVADRISPQTPHLVIWPESPMNFSYSRDPHLRKIVGDFARTEETAILLNSLEPAKDGGDQNSAILVNEKGEMSARYDKIRLMPFGEYVPLPHWLPGASSVRGLVGEFEPGSSYTLMPLGALRAGVFICIEAAHPSLARSFTNAGADVLINISNDGYLGPTAVMRQHLSNAIFRAVENDRDVVRVTNSGITAYIRADGRVFDQTTGFHEDVRTWTISKSEGRTTFYSRHGDVFVDACALISLGFISVSFMRRRAAEGRP
jgi:apolipoprotein N-acyltransferase